MGLIFYSFYAKIIQMTESIYQDSEASFDEKEKAIAEITDKHTEAFLQELRDKGILEATKGTTQSVKDAMSGMAIALVAYGGDVSDKGRIVHPEGEEERRELKRKLHTDKLTGLANFEALNAALPAAEADPNTEVIFIDANDFGRINKEISDNAGDDAIQYIAMHLAVVTEDIVGTSQRVFRKGGDEFVILVPKEKAQELKNAIVSLYGSDSDHGGMIKTDQGNVGYVAYNDIITSLSVGIGQTKDEADRNAQEFKNVVKPQLLIPINTNPDQMQLNV